jgi:hypothetical protein
MLSRKHYQKLAAALKSNRIAYDDNPDQHVQWCGDVQRIADVLEEDNPRFDRDRFLDAAGFNGDA